MRPHAECDLECFTDYFLAKFYYEATDTYESIGMWPGVSLDINRIVEILSSHTIITFNGNHYDMQMLVLALYGATTDQLKEANDDIIERKAMPWDFERKWGITIPDYIDHIDINEVAPGVRISLKAYMGRLHAPKMQDLPFVPGWVPQAADRFVLNDYCGNDLVGTNMLKREVWERVELRQSIGELYGVDVRSKSDAQIAETVFKAKLDFKPNKRWIADKYQFLYTPPAYVQFVSPQLQDVLATIRTAPFVVRDKEEAIAMGYYDPEDEEQPKIRTGVRIPDAIAGRDIVIGQGKYRIGIGGLHSQEKRTQHHTIPGVQTLRDIDVKSYYPSLILQMHMAPEQLGEAFTIIYRAIYDRRLMSKAEAQRLTELAACFGGEEEVEMRRLAKQMQTESDGLKIVLNGTFGKLFSKWSIFYAPELGIATTITGQLDLLMLIEMMEFSGIRVVSANTDGIVLLIPHGYDHIADQVVAWWEKRTGLEMESTFYRSLYSRDVNNYIAITTDGKVKRKGVFNNSGVLSGPQGKSPFMDICADAVVALLKSGTPIETTIRGCTDVRKFIVVRAVKGGAVDLPEAVAIADGQWLGKVVRWYYSGRPGYIGTAGVGNKVAGSEGATPCMQLPTQIPMDLNYGHYINAANKMLTTLGLTP